ncbi:hypothetical protein Taro_053492 [Colocasia esculenta]|uniref:Uncharacterized protein n=1 Tax=Colocasia esculenta TaxID=4460 RepID=A0A843XMY5_COLES|nr:hypothetical protein [Colocasia esculenta]
MRRPWWSRSAYRCLGRHLHVRRVSRTGRSLLTFTSSVRPKGGAVADFECVLVVVLPVEVCHGVGTVVVVVSERRLTGCGLTGYGVPCLGDQLLRWCACEAYGLGFLVIGQTSSVVLVLLSLLLSKICVNWLRSPGVVRKARSNLGQRSSGDLAELWRWCWRSWRRPGGLLEHRRGGAKQLGSRAAKAVCRWGAVELDANWVVRFRHAARDLAEPVHSSGGAVEAVAICGMLEAQPWRRWDLGLRGRADLLRWPELELLGCAIPGRCKSYSSGKRSLRLEDSRNL